jgi:methyltransferase (TIGR00027 family)
MARDIRFVPVDFTGDDLAGALAAAGHEPGTPTTWVWEGVVMDLTPAEVESTLGVVDRLSAPRSTLAVVYHAPGPLLHFIGPWVRWAGEPLRSAFEAGAMRDVLARHGFEVAADENIPGLAARLSPAIAREVRHMTHLRIAIAKHPSPHHLST